MSTDPQPPATDQNGRRDRRLIAMRQAKGWSQVQLAYEAGISLSTINRLERWRFKPNYEIARKLADEQECEIGEIFEHVNTPNLLAHSVL